MTDSNSRAILAVCVLMSTETVRVWAEVALQNRGSTGGPGTWGMRRDSLGWSCIPGGHAVDKLGSAKD